MIYYVEIPHIITKKLWGTASFHSHSTLVYLWDQMRHPVQFLHIQTNLKIPPQTSSATPASWNSDQSSWSPSISTALHSRMPETERNLAADQCPLGVHTCIIQLIICRNICGRAQTHHGFNVCQSGAEPQREPERLCRRSVALSQEPHAPVFDGSWSVFRMVWGEGPAVGGRLK